MKIETFGQPSVDGLADGEKKDILSNSLFEVKRISREIVSSVDRRSVNESALLVKGKCIALRQPLPKSEH